MNVFNVFPEVLKDKDLTYLDKTVFFGLITFNGRGKIYPSHKELGERIGCNSLNNISVSVNKLQEKGFIKIHKRFQKSNIYTINKIDSKMKNKQDPKKPKDKNESKDESIEYMDKAMIEIVAGEVAKAYDRSSAETSDFLFVNLLLKIKISDKYKDDNFNTVRKCLMLLYLINIHKDKFKNGNAYPYFQKVYSTSNYSILNKKIFSSGSITQTVSFKTGLHNSYI